MIVFDLDGTLIDSSRDLADAVSELVQAYGGPALTESDVVHMIGDGASVLVARALLHGGLDPKTPGALECFLRIYDRRLLDHTVAYEGMHEVLALLTERGPLAVLTNKPLAPTEEVLRHLGLRGFFSHIMAGDGPHPRKPDPTALRVLMASAASPPVMIGDSPVDAQTAAAAGCRFILASYGFGVAKFGGRLPDGIRRARHPRELVSLAETRTFDAARDPIVIR
ncbi:MAG: HAD-IA family hydrolase [Acidobacteriota bacterium]|nr:HAD-IA family hydrolase [Acidobacteriota bacterium]